MPNTNKRLFNTYFGISGIILKSISNNLNTLFSDLTDEIQNNMSSKMNILSSDLNADFQNQINGIENNIISIVENNIQESMIDTISSMITSNNENFIPFNELPQNIITEEILSGYEYIDSNYLVQNDYVKDVDIYNHPTISQLQNYVMQLEQRITLLQNAISVYQTKLQNSTIEIDWHDQEQPETETETETQPETETETETE